MSPFDTFSGPVGQRLALTLLHFLWQGLAVVLVLVALLRWFPMFRAPVRYALCLAALLLMAVCPIVTFAVLEIAPSRGELALARGKSNAEPRRDLNRLGLPSATRPPAPSPSLAEPEPRPPGASQPGVHGRPAKDPASQDPPAWQHRLALWRPHLGQYARVGQPYLLIGWITGVFWLSGRFLLAQLSVPWLRRGRRPLPAGLASRAARLGKGLGLRFELGVFQSGRVREAIAVGLLRPMILLPASWVGQMTPEILEAVIAHELAHIRRLDLWVNLFQRLVETLFFYHPAVWWLSRRMRLEREMCCDELAVGVTGERVVYAKVLELVGRRRLFLTRPELGLAVGGGKMALFLRVQNILGLSPSYKCARWWPAGLLALLVPLAIWLASTTLAGPGTGEARAESGPPNPAAATDFGRRDQADPPPQVNGLCGRLLLLPGKAMCRASEHFEVRLELNNAGNSPLTVQTNNPLAFRLEITDGQGSRVKPIWGRAELTSASGWKTLQPGARLCFMPSLLVKDGTRESPTSSWKLPPGKYEVSATYSSEGFRTTTSDEQPEDEEPENVWKGELALPPIPVEVVADDVRGVAEGGNGEDKAVLRLAIRCDAEHLKVGDEIPITFIISNRRTTAYKYADRLADRGGRMQEYALVARDEWDIVVPDPRARAPVGIGGGLSSQALLPAGDWFAKTIPLNRWALLTRPGKYRVFGIYDAREGPGRSSTPGVNAVWSAPITITIQPRSDEEMAAYVRRLTTSLDAAGKGSQRRELIKKLMYTCDRRIVPALIEQMYGDWDPAAWWAREAFIYYLPEDRSITRALLDAAARRGLATEMLRVLRLRRCTAEQIKPLIDVSLSPQHPDAWHEGVNGAMQYRDERFMPRLIAIALGAGRAPLVSPAQETAILAVAADRTDEGVAALRKLLEDPEPAIRKRTEEVIRTAYEYRRDWPGRPLRDDDFEPKYRKPRER